MSLPWLFNGTPVEEIDIKTYRAFVYVITSLVDGKKYVGYKNTTKIRKTKGKARRVRTESDWKDYYGSSDVLKSEIESHGKEMFTREIISFHKTEGDARYFEVREQFLRNVLEDDNYINDNINGKWHSKPLHIIESRLIANTGEQLS